MGTILCFFSEKQRQIVERNGLSTGKQYKPLYFRDQFYGAIIEYTMCYAFNLDENQANGKKALAMFDDMKYVGCGSHVEMTQESEEFESTQNPQNSKCPPLYTP